MNALPTQPCSIIFVWNNPPLIDSCIKLANTLRDLGYAPLFLLPSSEFVQPILDSGYDYIAVREYIQQYPADIDSLQPRISIVKGSIFFNKINITKDTWYESECITNGMPSPLGCNSADELPVHALMYLDAFDRLLTESNASLCYFWNGMVYPPKALKTICHAKNIPAFSLERGLLPERLVVDPIGINYGGSLGGKSGDQILQKQSTRDHSAATKYLNEFCRNKISVVNHGIYLDKIKLCQKLGISPSKKIILFPNQIDWDTNILYYSPHYKTNSLAISELTAAASHLPDAFIIVKSHPEDTIESLNGLQEILGNYGTVVTDIALPALLESAYALVVRNSTVGLEGILYDKPVVSLGLSSYSGKGLTYDISERGEILSKLLSFWGVDIPSIPSHNNLLPLLTHLLNEYHYDLNINNTSKEHNFKLIHDKIVAACVKPIRPNVHPTTSDEKINTMKIIAIISAHNEGDVIYHVIGDLILQGIEVYLINHCSTDSTVTEASKWLGKGLLHIENFPQDAGYPEINKEQYIWQQILQRKEELADQLGADWYIHSDADEFRESPWPGLTLKQAIQVADRMGYNALDFELLNFRPVNNYFIPGTDVRETLRYYEGSEDFNSLQIKAWKNLHIPVSIFKNGGHDITFPGRSVCPIKFLLRHYPIRSQSHGERKVFQERKNRFNSKERKVGWHIQYDLIEDERHNFLQSPSTLSLYDGDQVRLKILSSQARRMAEELSGIPAPAMESPQQCRTVVTGRSSCGAATSAGISQLITRANDMANNGKSTEALQLYQQALEVDPGNCRALVGIGVVTLLQGNHTEAAISFSKALRTSPQDTNALCGLGMARLGQERHAIGFELFKKALDADPENLTAVAELTRCAYRLNRHGEAAGYVQRYLMHHPADKDMLFSLAGLLYKAGNLSEAYEQLERLLTFYPEYEGGEEFAHKLIAEMRESQNESATVQQLMASGQHHKEAGNYEEALVSFSRAHDLGEVSVLAQMGNCLARLGRLDEATTHYKSALQQDESNVDALIGLGVASLLSGKQVQAVTWFNKALKVDPADSQALTGLGMARTQQNKQKEAFPLFASALSGDPENLTALNELLRIAYEHDRLPEAEPFLKSYLMYHPTHQHILYSLAGLLYRIGKLTEAQETLERLTLFEPEYEGGKELEELIVNAMSTRETSAINEHGTL